MDEDEEPFENMKLLSDEDLSINSTEVPDTAQCRLEGSGLRNLLKTAFDVDPVFFCFRLECLVEGDCHGADDVQCLLFDAEHVNVLVDQGADVVDEAILWDHVLQCQYAGVQNGS